MTEFLDDFLVIAQKAKDAGAVLGLTLYLPYPDEEWLYELKILTESDDPKEQLVAVSNYIGTPEFEKRLAAALVRIEDQRISNETDAKLREFKFEMDAVDLLYLANRSQENAYRIDQLLKEKTGEQFEEIMRIYTDYVVQLGLRSAVEKLTEDRLLKKRGS